MNASAVRVTPQHVLVTGSSGAVGRAVCAGLAARGHHVHAYDLAPPPADIAFSHVTQADLTDGPAMLAAVQRVDTIIHFAAYPLSDGRFEEDLLEPNYRGMYTLYEAVTQAQIRRIIIASTVQVNNGSPRDRTIHPDDPARPTNDYGVSKVFAEALAYRYHQSTGLSTVVARIGWFLRDEDEYNRCAKRERSQCMYLSRGDCMRFFSDAVEAQDVTFATCYAMSKPDKVNWFDLEPSRTAIGYQPQDVFPQGTEWLFETSRADDEAD